MIYGTTLYLGTGVTYSRCQCQPFCSNKFSNLWLCQGNWYLSFNFVPYIVATYSIHVITNKVQHNWQITEFFKYIRSSITDHVHTEDFEKDKTHFSDIYVSKEINFRLPIRRYLWYKQKRRKKFYQYHRYYTQIIRLIYSTIHPLAFVMPLEKEIGCNLLCCSDSYSEDVMCSSRD